MASTRYFFALCALALIAAVVSAPVEEEVQLDEVDVEDEERFLGSLAKAAAKQVIALLAKHYIKIKLECLPEVPKNCHMSLFQHPQQYYRCADNYFQAHADRCLRK